MKHLNEDFYMEEYSELALRTKPSYIMASEHLANACVGIAGESGEVCDLMKKTIFHSHPLNKEKLKEELGDLLWYINYLASIQDISLQEIMQYNIEKLKKRYPDGFSARASQERKD